MYVSVKFATFPRDPFHSKLLIHSRFSTSKSMFISPLYMFCTWLCFADSHGYQGVELCIAAVCSSDVTLFLYIAHIIYLLSSHWHLLKFIYFYTWTTQLFPQLLSPLSLHMSLVFTLQIRISLTVGSHADI